MSGPDISDLVLAIIDRIGFDPNDTQGLIIDARHPTLVLAMVYDRDSSGAKHLNDNGDPAVHSVIIPAVSRQPGKVPASGHFFLATPAG